MIRDNEILSRRRNRSVRSSLLCVALCLAASGCQTSSSFRDECPGIYSGVRYYSHQIDRMPWDGKIFFGIDLPFSALLDTLLLPFTAFVETKRPESGWVPGCKWVDE